MDLHEALLTRGDVQGNQEWSWLIYHPSNCVLVHHVCHMRIIGKGGVLTFAKCARQLVQYEGYQNVLAFLDAMKQYYPTVADFALRRFEGLALKPKDGDG